MLALFAVSIVPPHDVRRYPSGAEAYYFKSAKTPLFEARMVFEGGSDNDPPGRSGLGMFSASMIKRGVEGMDEDEIARRLDDLAAGVDIAVDDDQVMISAYGLNEHADAVFDLMFRELVNPTFPERPFLRIKANHLDGIDQIPESPGGLAARALEVVLFNGTVKARPAGGLKSDVARISLADARDWYRKLMRVDRLKALVIGGSGSGAEVIEKFERRLAALSCVACGTALAQPAVERRREWELPPGEVLVIERPGIPEAHVRMGFIGPKRDIPEFYDLRVAEAILSGYFGSRLNLIIREKLGLTYGIDAGFSFGRTTGVFGVSTSTRNEKIGVLLTEVRKLLEGFVAGDVSDSEIGMARDFLTGSFPLSLQNEYTVAAAFFNGLLNGLRPDFLDVYSPKIKAVTRESLLAAVRKHFRLDRMVTVVAGDSRAIAPRLRKAGIRHQVRRAEVYL